MLLSSTVPYVLLPYPNLTVTRAMLHIALTTRVHPGVAEVAVPAGSRIFPCAKLCQSASCL